MKRKCFVVVLMIMFFCKIVIVCREHMISKDFDKYFEKIGLEDGYDNVSITKTYSGKLSDKKMNEIIHGLVKGIEGEIIYIKTWDNKVCVYAYSSLLNNSVLYNGKKININIVLSYMKDMKKTNIHMATPMVNIDY